MPTTLLMLYLRDCVPIVCLTVGNTRLDILFSLPSFWSIRPKDSSETTELHKNSFRVII